jgi:hypothetical protein
MPVYCVLAKTNKQSKLKQAKMYLRMNTENTQTLLLHNKGDGVYKSDVPRPN